MPGNLFYKYYDALFQNKDYQKETDLVFNLSKKFGIKSPQKILEIGCGTGNHTRLLSKSVSNLIAIDTDLEMVKIARKKLSDCPNIKIIHTPVENLNIKKFDLAIAMFNVVTYIERSKELERFMKGVANRLSSGGIFIFDCWNGVAAIKDPPVKKITNLKYRNESITVTLTPSIDLFNQKVRLNYQIHVKETSEKDNFQFNQTLWTPMQIYDAVSQAGMEVIICSPIMKPNRKATENDWKILFVCKKS